MIVVTKSALGFRKLVSMFSINPQPACLQDWSLNKFEPSFEGNYLFAFFD